MAVDCERSLEAVVSLAPHAVVVDASWPPRTASGLPDLRDMSVAPLIVLADDASVDEVDELLAFSSGADDYIRMPCSPRVLRARLAAAMRRVERASGKPLATAYQIGPLAVDTGTRRATVGGAPLHLTRIEFELLAALAENRQRVLTRGELLNRVWGPWPGDDHVVEVHLSRLRRKILAAGGPRIGEPVPGVGYRLCREAA
ncbi:MAG: response regulator transcription factor [Actinomycetales bacterium]|nr:response regulator transcription factor [Candidatus Phosphoribacter baldrii]